MGGLRTKLDVLRGRIYLLSPEPDIIVLTETWLPTSISASVLGLHNYSIYRKDRAYNDDVDRGGGVLIAIRNTYMSKLCVPNLFIDSDSFDQLFVSVQFGTKKILFGALYIQPGTNSSEEDFVNLTANTENISSDFPDHDLVLLGDYNLPFVKWKFDSYLDVYSMASAPASVRAKAVVVCNCFAYLGMNQFYPSKINKDYTLDLAFSGLELKHIPSPDCIFPPSLHHDHAFFEIPATQSSMLPFSSVQYNFYKGNYEVLNTELSAFNWDDLLCSNDVNCDVDVLYDKLLSCIAKNVPLRRVYNLDSFPVWYTHDLKVLIASKKRAHRVWRTYGQQDDYIQFKKIRAQCLRLSEKCHTEYIQRMEEDIRLNTKKFWNYINNLKS